MEKVIFIKIVKFEVENLKLKFCVHILELFKNNLCLKLKIFFYNKQAKNAQLLGINIPYAFKKFKVGQCFKNKSKMARFFKFKLLIILKLNFNWGQFPKKNIILVISKS